MIDFNVLTKYLDDDEEVIQMVLMTYQEDHSDSVREVQTAFQSQNWEELHHIVHTLKGILSSFGEETAVTVLEKIEQSTLKNQAPNEQDIAIVLNEIEQINRQISEAVEAYAM